MTQKIIRLDIPLTTCGNDRNLIMAEGRRRGIENLESGNKKEAIKCFEKAISIDPG